MLQTLKSEPNSGKLLIIKSGLKYWQEQSRGIEIVLDVTKALDSCESSSVLTLLICLLLIPQQIVLDTSLLDDRWEYR